MSLRALMIAARDQLWSSNLGLNQQNCDLTPKGQPPPVCGEMWVGVWGGAWRNLDPNGLSRHDGHGLNVTVSLRFPKVPWDRIGPEIIAKASVGLQAQCEAIVAKLHMDPQDSIETGVMWRANRLIGANVNGFQVPLIFQDGGQAEVRGGVWWWSRNKEPLAGVVQTMSWGGAERCQVIEFQT